MITYCNGHYFYESGAVFIEVQAKDVVILNGRFVLVGGVHNGTNY